MSRRGVPLSTLTRKDISRGKDQGF
jgi:hypothetical protein